jgi:hypothetical protein
VHDQLVPGLLQIGRHALAHHAEPDESDAHVSLRRWQSRYTASFCRTEHPSARIATLPPLRERLEIISGVTLRKL